ncbi:MAG: hypothetical protein ACJ74Q_15505 [Pyrinomonadaceae bacterium]
MEKLNCVNIIIAHVRTLKNAGSGRYRPADFITFFLLPYAAALLPIILGLKVGDGFNSSLVLFAGLNGIALVSALSLLLRLAHDADAQACSPSANSPVRLRLIRETHANISYALLSAVLLGAAALTRTALGQPEGGTAALAPQAAAFVCVFLAANLSLTLLMILRRVNVLMHRQLEAG